MNKESNRRRPATDRRRTRPKPHPAVTFDGRALSGKIRRRGNGVWYADVYDPAKKRDRYSLGSTDLDEAREQLRADDLETAERFGLVRPGTAADGRAQLTIAEGLRIVQDHSRGVRAGAQAITGVSANTLKKYLQQDRDFQQFCVDAAVHTWAQLTDEVAHRYGSWLVERGNGGGTVHDKLVRLVSVVNLLIQKDRLPPTLKLRLKLTKPPSRDVHCYTEEQVAALVEAAFKQEQETAGRLIHLLARTGMRVDEACHLRWRDVRLDESGGTIHIRSDESRRTKSGRAVNIPIPAELAESMKTWPRRGELVFVRESGRAARPGWLLKLLQNHLIPSLTDRFNDPNRDGDFAAGTVHGLRHHFVSSAIKAGLSPTEIQRLIGQRDSRVIDRYIHLRPADTRPRLDKLVRRATPINSATDTTGPGADAAKPKGPTS